MNKIEHIIEPKRLFLVWQQDFYEKDIRCRVAELVNVAGNVELHYLFNTEDFNFALENDFDGFPAFSIDQKKHDVGVLAVFMRRLPPRSRSDYHLFLDALRLPESAKNLSDFALLDYAEAKLPGDTFSIINAFEEVEAPCEFITEVARILHHDAKDINLVVGTEVNFIIEPDNPVEPDAVKIMIGETHIGYVNRVQRESFVRWLRQNKVKGVIDKINGDKDKRRVKIFVTVEK